MIHQSTVMPNTSPSDESFVNSLFAKLRLLVIVERLMLMGYFATLLFVLADPMSSAYKLLSLFISCCLFALLTYHRRLFERHYGRNYAKWAKNLEEYNPVTRENIVKLPFVSMIHPSLKTNGSRYFRYFVVTLIVISFLVLL